MKLLSLHDFNPSLINHYACQNLIHMYNNISKGELPLMTLPSNLYLQ